MTKKEFRLLTEQAVVNVQELLSEGKAIEWGNVKETPLMETVGTSDGGKEFVEKVTYDIYRGRERVPLVYGRIYETIVDANYPRVLTEKNMGPVQVVFVKTLEFEGVKFGTIGPGEEKVVRFFTFAAGIEITEDMIEYNETWNITEVATAFGENYNKLLNHNHLDPIISGSYTTTGGGLAAQKAAQEAGTAQLIAFDTDLETTLMNAITVLPRGTVILANSFDQNKIEAALAASMYQDNSPTKLKRTITANDIIYYEGSEVEVGEKIYEYPGVTAGYIYLVVPQRQFKERVKHDLRLSTLDEEPRRLIAGGTVGRSRRAVYSALGGKYGAIKVDIAQ